MLVGFHACLFNDTHIDGWYYMSYRFICLLCDLVNDVVDGVSMFSLLSSCWSTYFNGFMTNHFRKFVYLQSSLGNSISLMSSHMDKIELGFLEGGLIVESDGILT